MTSKPFTSCKARVAEASRFQGIVRTLLSAGFLACVACGDLEASHEAQAGADADAGTDDVLQDKLLQRVLAPVADSWVDQRRSTANYGTATGLSVDTDPYTQSALLRFTVPSMSEVIQGTKLRLYVTNGSSDGPKIYLVDNSWSETGVTWQNRPSPSGNSIANLGNTAAGWVDVDVSSAIKGPGTYSFYLIGQATDGINFNSREAANPPQLVLSTSAPGDQCPFDQTKTAPGVCGCGVPDTDSDRDGTANCREVTNFSFPVRAAFYYAWYPQTWTVNGKHVFYHPTSGYYNSSDLSLIDRHIDMMEHAKINLAIVSWWGKGTQSDPRIKLLLDRTVARGSKIKWAFYYEDEGSSDPSPATIAADLDYLKSLHGNSPALARFQDKPMVFVWSAGDNPCEVASRWASANRPTWFVDIKLGSGFKDCSVQPDAWHQYGPSSRALYYKGTSFSVSPGFWRADRSSPDLARDVGAFRQAVRDMVASGEKWQFVTTFNEWGEGTAVESAKEWSSTSGYGQYLDALHNDGQ